MSRSRSPGPGPGRGRRRRSPAGRRKKGERGRRLPPLAKASGPLRNERRRRRGPELRESASTYHAPVVRSMEDEWRMLFNQFKQKKERSRSDLFGVEAYNSPFGNFRITSPRLEELDTFPWMNALSVDSTAAVQGSRAATQRLDNPSSLLSSTSMLDGEELPAEGEEGSQVLGGPGSQSLGSLGQGSIFESFVEPPPTANMGLLSLPPSLKLPPVPKQGQSQHSSVRSHPSIAKSRSLHSNASSVRHKKKKHHHTTTKRKKKEDDHILAQPAWQPSTTDVPVLFEPDSVHPVMNEAGEAAVLLGGLMSDLHGKAIATIDDDVTELMAIDFTFIRPQQRSIFDNVDGNDGDEGSGGDDDDDDDDHHHHPDPVAAKPSANAVQAQVTASELPKYARAKELVQHLSYMSEARLSRAEEEHVANTMERLLLDIADSALGMAKEAAREFDDASSKQFLLFARWFLHKAEGDLSEITVVTASILDERAEVEREASQRVTGVRKELAEPASNFDRARELIEWLVNYHERRRFDAHSREVADRQLLAQRVGNKALDEADKAMRQGHFQSAEKALERRVWFYDQAAGVLPVQRIESLQSALVVRRSLVAFETALPRDEATVEELQGNLQDCLSHVQTDDLELSCRVHDALVTLSENSRKRVRQCLQRHEQHPGGKLTLQERVAGLPEHPWLHKAQEWLEANDWTLASLEHSYRMQRDFIASKCENAAARDHFFTNMAHEGVQLMSQPEQESKVLQLREALGQVVTAVENERVRITKRRETEMRR